MKISEIISEVDKQRRIENITQEDMAKRFGISRTTYNNYLMGKTVPNDEMLRKMFAFIKGIDAEEKSLFDKDVLPASKNIPPFDDTDKSIIRIETKKLEEPHYFTLKETAKFLIEESSGGELKLVFSGIEEGDKLMEELEEMDEKAT